MSASQINTLLLSVVIVGGSLLGAGILWAQFMAVSVLRNLQDAFVRFLDQEAALWDRVGERHAARAVRRTKAEVAGHE